MVLDAARSAPLNILHLHGDKVYLDLFWHGWIARGINYSTHGTKVPVTNARKAYDGILMGGLDEVNFRKLTPAQLRDQMKSAQASAGRKFILAPGCSVPNETSDEEILKLTRIVTA
jgi:uroporphyrinogen-III decarboxylase